MISQTNCTTNPTNSYMFLTIFGYMKCSHTIDLFLYGPRFFKPPLADFAELRAGAGVGLLADQSSSVSA